MRFSELKTPKDFEQFTVLKKWAEADFRGTYKGTTGVGKTRIGVEAIALSLKRFQENNPEKIPSIIIGVPTENLRDNEWKNEFEKWGYLDIFNNYVKVKCYQTLSKEVGNFYDIFIADEAHNFISPKFFNFYLSNQFEKILLLTATLPKNKENEIKDLFPVFHTTSLKDALLKGIVSPFKIYNFGIDFTLEEKEEYDKQSSTIRELFVIFSNNFEILNRALNNEHFYKGLCKQQEIDYNPAIPKILIGAINKRSNVIYNSINKIKVSADILNRVNKKCLTFFERTSSALECQKLLNDQLNSSVFDTSKNSKDKKAILNNFSQSKNEKLIAVKALNQGFNVPECDLAIIASGTGSKVDFPQRLGRILRVQENKQAICIQLYIKNSKDKDWVTERTKDIPNVEEVKDFETLIKLINDSN